MPCRLLRMLCCRSLNRRPRTSGIAGVAKRWTTEEVHDALQGLLRVDRLLKSSPLPEDLVLEEWLLSLETRALQAV